MSAGRTAGALAAISLVVFAGIIAVPASAGDGPTTIGIRNGDEERSFYLTRTKVKPGPALIQYTNTGEDPHDVKIRRKGSSKVVALPETQSGEVNTFPVMKLKGRLEVHPVVLAGRPPRVRDGSRPEGEEEALGRRA